MNILNTVPPFPYHDPWVLSYGERFRMLVRGKKRVAYFYERADNSTFRYRAYNMAQVLNDSPDDVSASYFFLSDMDRLNDIADAADKLVICRARYDVDINRLIHAFRRRGKEIIFDVDDLVFDVQYMHLILRTLNKNVSDQDVLNTWYAYCSRIGATLKNCDSAITTNEFLADRIRDFSGLPTCVVPNFLNKEQLEISDRIYHLKSQCRSNDSSSITLGYFSGSPSHVNDFALILPAIEKLMSNFSTINLVIVGFIEVPGIRDRFKSTRVRYYPFADYVNLQRLVGAVDFNLVPLQFNTFTNCKSQLKYFDAAVVGTQTIASPTFTYAGSIRDGDNGFLSKAHEWDSTILRAIDLMPQYSEMAKRAREDALLHFAWYNQRDTLLKALGFLENKP